MSHSPNGGQELSHWDRLVPLLIHPVKVSVIEAMTWLEVPVSPRELDRLLDEQFGVSLISYHVKGMAEAGAIESVSQKQVRGAIQTFYVLARSSDS